jgi:hypothetical protein
MKYFLSMLVIIFIATPFASAGDNPKEQKEKAKSNKSYKNRKQAFEAYIKRVIAKLPKAEQEKLKKLYKENPKEYSNEIRKVLAREKMRHYAKNDKIKELLKKYQNAKNADEKEKYLNQITEHTKKIFYDRMKQNQKRLIILEKKVRMLRKHYEFRKKNADKIIKSRVDYLTRNPKLDW